MTMRYIWPAVLAGCLLMTAGAHAGSGGPDGGRKEEFRKKWEAKVKEIYRQLELSPDQQKQLEDNRGRYKEKRRDLYGRIRQTRKEMNRQLQKADLDMARLRQLHAEIKDLKAAKEDLRFDSILQVRKILSARQFQQFMTLKEELRSDRWRKRSGR